jgi:hypothetical protein
MDSLLLAAAVLACPVGMGLMMWFMMRGHGESADADKRSEVEQLRAEVERLKADRAAHHAEDER